MHGSNKHSTLKGLLLKLGEWSRACLHNRSYKAHTNGRYLGYHDDIALLCCDCRMMRRLGGY